MNKDIDLSNSLIITHNWNIENDKNITDSFTCSKNFTQENDLEEIVKLETCVHFTFQENMDSSNLILNIKIKDFLIFGIIVVSEARIIELYGKNGEYLSTHHANLIDDFQDMQVYIVNFKFCQSLPECSIKFAGLRQKKSIWVYGLRTFIQDYIKPEINGLKAFTRNAEDYMKLLHNETASSLRSHPNPIVKAMLKSFLPNKNENEDIKENKPLEFLILKKLSYIEHEIRVDNEIKEKLVNIEPILKKLESLTLKMENRLNNLEKKISNLEIKEKEKFDCIISLIEDIKNKIEKE